MAGFGQAVNQGQNAVLALIGVGTIQERLNRAAVELTVVPASDWPEELRTEHTSILTLLNQTPATEPRTETPAATVRDLSDEAAEAAAQRIFLLYDRLVDTT